MLRQSSLAILVTAFVTACASKPGAPAAAADATADSATAEVAPAADTTTADSVAADTAPDAKPADTAAVDMTTADQAATDAKPDVTAPDTAVVDSTAGDATAVDAATADLTGDITTLSQAVELVGAGWSFGECLGSCKGDATFAGASIDFVVSDWDKTVKHHAKGILTTGAAAKLETLQTALGGAALQDVYGCPDCADGGAAYVLLSHGGATTKHSYEFGKPPAVLKGIDTLVAAAMAGLKACKGDETVVVSNPCPVDAP